MSQLTSGRSNFLQELYQSGQLSDSLSSSQTGLSSRAASARISSSSGESHGSAVIGSSTRNRCVSACHTLMRSTCTAAE